MFVLLPRTASCWDILPGLLNIIACRAHGCVRFVGTQARPNSSMEWGGGHEAHPWLRSSWDLLAAWERKGGTPGWADREEGERIQEKSGEGVHVIKPPCTKFLKN